MTIFDRITDKLVEVPALMIELAIFVVIFGIFAWSHSVNGVLNGVIIAAAITLLCRRMGYSTRIADWAGMTPGDKIQSPIRPKDFQKFNTVTLDGNTSQTWRRLAHIRVRPPSGFNDDIYDILVNPIKIGKNNGDPVFDAMLFRHRDDKIWKTAIVFNSGIVEFDFQKIDRDIPLIRISLRKGPEDILSKRRAVPQDQNFNPEPLPKSRGNRFDDIADRIIGTGPKNKAEAERMRRTIAMAIHPDRGTPSERKDRSDALGRVNNYIDEFIDKGK